MQIISLHASAPSDGQALDLAFTTVLRRKGRVLEAMTDGTSALRRRLNPQDRELLDRLSGVRSQLAAQVLAGPGKTDLALHEAAEAEAGRRGGPSGSSYQRT